MMVNVTIKGVDKLQQKLKDNATLDDVRTVVKLNGAELQAEMVRNADFKKGYQTGATKESIGSEYSDGGMTVTVGATTEYSPYLEHGTRYMEAQPFVKPSLNAQKPIFINDLKKLMK